MPGFRIALCLIALAAGHAYAATTQTGGRPAGHAASSAFPWPDFDDFLRQLTAKAGLPLRIYKLKMGANGVDLWIQNPRQPDFVDSYEYDEGDMKGPIPIKFEKYPTLEAIDGHVIPREQVDFARLPTLADLACVAANLPDANVIGIKLERSESRGKTKRWMPIWEFSLRSGDKYATVTYDLEGNLLHVDK